jgi:hypothetical protein
MVYKKTVKMTALKRTDRCFQSFRFLSTAAPDVDAAAAASASAFAFSTSSL